MNDSKFSQIENNLNRLSALFAAIGSIAITVEQTSENSSMVTGEGISLMSNLNYLAEMKDEIIDNTEMILAQLRDNYEELMGEHQQLGAAVRMPVCMRIVACRYRYI